MKLAKRLHEVGYGAGSDEKVHVLGSKCEQLRETEVGTRMTETKRVKMSRTQKESG